MHLTLETDYAIRIIDCIARDGNRIGASAISERTGVTLRFSLKILRKLVASEIIRSYKGANGGYVLARTPDKISLGDIIQTIEGPYFINRCLRDGHICNRVGDGFCPYHELFGDISSEVRNRFDSINVADMIREV